MSSSDRVRLVSDKLTSLCSSPVAHGDTNSCGVVHDNSRGVIYISLLFKKSMNIFTRDVAPKKHETIVEDQRLL